MDTDNLLRQHQEMLDLAAKIGAYQSQLEIKNNASAISNLLSQLAGKLKMHLMVEDKFVYPKLAMHSDTQIQKTSQKFSNEMGDLGQAFGDYKTKYLGASKIADNADLFMIDTKSVFAALTKRMDQENHSLYPLLNK
ncbi:hemerythrin domain-containing protein [Pelosinus sp. sgz500959]|uniref:hemerythrin domain-containing protein n=1 Tax=Pelosinus sp. sgz500959 TaxID=3242472 RepID=UPI00366E5B23